MSRFIKRPALCGFESQQGRSPWERWGAGINSRTRRRVGLAQNEGRVVGVVGTDPGEQRGDLVGGRATWPPGVFSSPSRRSGRRISVAGLFMDLSLAQRVNQWWVV
jgi:hypothetical protein